LSDWVELDGVNERIGTNVQECGECCDIVADARTGRVNFHTQVLQESVYVCTSAAMRRHKMRRHTLCLKKGPNFETV